MGQELEVQNGCIELSILFSSLELSERQRAHYMASLESFWRILRVRPQEILQFPEAARADKAFMLEALRSSQGCEALLAHADEILLDDKEFMTKAVCQTGRALKYASSTIRADKDVVIAAL